jgi:hypothetical protein
VTVARERRPRRRRGRRLLWWLLGLGLVALAFGIGVAVGQALHDNPKPGITVTTVETITP